MAKIGLKYPVYKGATRRGVIAKAIQADIAITTNNVILYADDAAAESDKSFQSGTITLGVDDLPDVVQSEFLGHSIDGTTGEITANTNDRNPYVGVGFYGVKMVNGIRKYRAIWLPKVQFAEPADTNATKGETVTFNTPVLEGTIMIDDNGDWKKENTFSTEVEARAYLEAKAGITPQCTTPQADVPSGTYAVAQTVSLTAGTGESIYYTTNGLTPSATNGTLYSTPINIADDTMLRVIAIKDGYSDSEIINYEYIIMV